METIRRIGFARYDKHERPAIYSFLLLMKVEKIAFVHARKTGGSLVDGVLWRAYRKLGLTSAHLYSFDRETCREDAADSFRACNTIKEKWDDGCALCKPSYKIETKGCPGCLEWVKKFDFHYVELHHFDMSLALKLKQELGFKLVTLLREPSRQFESDANFEAYTRGGAQGYMPGYGKGFDGFSRWAIDRRGPFEQFRMVPNSKHCKQILFKSKRSNQHNIDFWLLDRAWGGYGKQDEDRSVSPGYG